MCVLVNTRDAFFWKKFTDVGYKNESMVQHALMVGHTNPAVQVGAGAMFAPQTEFWIGGPITVVNYGQAGALRGCADVSTSSSELLTSFFRPVYPPPFLACDSYLDLPRCLCLLLACVVAQCNSEIELRQGGYTYRWQGVQFINSPKKVLWTAPFKQIFWDLDGSLTGFANGWVTPYYRWNEFTPACTRQDSVYDRGLVCDDSVVVRRLQLDYVNPRELDFMVCCLCVCCVCGGRGKGVCLCAEVSGTPSLACFVCV